MTTSNLIILVVVVISSANYGYVELFSALEVHDAQSSVSKIPQRDTLSSYSSSSGPFIGLQLDSDPSDGSEDDQKSRYTDIILMHGDDELENDRPPSTTRRPSDDQLSCTDDSACPEEMLCQKNVCHCPPGYEYYPYLLTCLKSK